MNILCATACPAPRPGSKTGADSRPGAVRHLTQVELAQRWRISPRTLERWRWVGQGPGYLKIGGRVVYRLEDIETFEAETRREAGR